MGGQEAGELSVRMEWGEKAGVQSRKLHQVCVLVHLFISEAPIIMYTALVEPRSTTIVK